jgi:hypothetical protein
MQNVLPYMSESAATPACIAEYESFCTLQYYLLYFILEFVGSKFLERKTLGTFAKKQRS